MNVVLNQFGVIVAKGIDVHVQEDGIFCDDTVYVGSGFTSAVIPDGVSFSIQKHKFINGAVVDNEDYTPSREELQSVVNDLKAQNAAMLLALVEGGLM